MSKLFEKNKSTISRHISNIYEESELDKQATVAKNAIVQIEEENLLTNCRNGSKIDEVKSGKNKILSFINRKTKEDK